MKFKIIHTNDLGSTPAKAIRKFGIIYINTPIFYKLPKDTQDYIIEHEKAHIVNDSNDEVDADNLAFLNFAGSRPFSLKKSINALCDGLSFDRDEHLLRLYKQIERALIFDYKVNKNKKAILALNKMKAAGTNFLKPVELNSILLESAYINPINLHSSNFDGINPNSLKIMDTNISSNNHMSNSAYQNAAAIAAPRIYSLKENAVAEESHFIKKPINRKKSPLSFQLKPLFYQDNSFSKDTIEEQILSNPMRFGPGGGGSSMFYDDEVTEDTGSDKMLIDNEKSKFLGMPRKTGIAVTIAAAVVVLGIIAYFIFKK